jgi:hypothetical protein
MASPSPSSGTGHRLPRAERLGQDDDDAPDTVGARHGALRQR